MAHFLTIPGYHIGDKPLYLSHTTRIYKGFVEGVAEIAAGKKQEVIIKTAFEPSLKQNECLRMEYKLLTQLHKENKASSIVRALAFLEYKHSYILVLEYLPLPSLKDILAQEKKLSLSDALLFTINIARALECVHEQNIIHKDINPSNILCDLQAKTIKLIDFGSAINLPKEYVSINIKRLEGTLAYIAPEQSGYMNRGIDYRCDHYALGISLYQMLTGILPFKGQNALELVHQHMTVIPKTPHEVDASIPEVVSDIVMKLIKKNCEERYQSLYGLIFDLEKCLTQLHKEGQVVSFPIANQDRYQRFQIPEKMYGREAEIDILMDAYKESIQGQASLMLVAGQAGIGKTSLVHEIYKSIVREQGYFISGKFEKFQRYNPFSALSQAFNTLVEYIIVEDAPIILHYKKAILEAIGNSGQLLLDIIPNLQMIIGPQPPLPPVSVDKTKDRLAYVFHQFFHALNWIEHPLVIFLDDVQWIDDASLYLLQEIMAEGESRYLLFIAAYRSNEVDSSHHFMHSVINLKRNGIKVHEIDLSPLGIKTIQALLADTLYQPLEQVEALASICHSKTAGNPFFLNQLLLRLADDELIVFDRKNNQWSWNLNLIKNSYISPNVVDLLTKKIQNLSLSVQQFLQNAACIGMQFDLTLLAKLVQEPESGLFPLLQEAQREGLIEVQESSGFVIRYKFAHNRIQQAALSLMPEEKQKEIHLKLAHFILQDSSDDALDKIIFTLLQHYNTLISPQPMASLDAAEKEKIAYFNLRGAKLSKMSGAYAASLNFIEHALRCVDQNLWETHYAWMLELYLEAIEAAYLSSEYNKVAIFAALSYQNARETVDKLKIIHLQVKAYSSQLKVEPAVKLVRKALRLMNIAFPQKVKTHHVLIALIKAHLHLRKNNSLAILKHGELQDPAQKALALLVASVFDLTYRNAPNTYALLVCLSALNYLKQGYSQGVEAIYAALAVLEIGILNAIPKGLDLYAVAQDLSAKYGAEERGKIVLNAGVYLHHKVPVYKIVPQLESGFSISFGCGDFISAFDIASLECVLAIFTEPIQAAQMRLQRYLALVKKTKQLFVESSFLILLGGVKKLENSEKDPCDLSFKDYDEAASLQLYQTRNEATHLAATYFFKLMLGVIYEAYSRAWSYGLDFEPYQQGLLSTYFIPRFYFYQALAGLQLVNDQTFNRNYRRRIARSIKKLSHLASFCAYNYQHQVSLLQAECIAKIKKKPEKARHYYELAIEEAKKNRFIIDEALAHELAAKYYIAQDWPLPASLHMQEARGCYSLCGMQAKVMQLETNYPLFFQNIEEPQSVEFEITESQHSLSSETDSLVISSSLDIKTILKAAHTLPATLILSDLLQKLMRMLIENVGAEKSILLLQKKGKYVIEAQQTILDEKSSFLQGIKMTEDNLPLSVIRTVIGGKKALLLNNAMSRDPYNQDQYIIKQKVKSILCLPLLKKSALYGILYLENNSAGASFSKERFDLLNLLLSQITISIQNAKFYSKTLALNKANERFVPLQFLSILNRKNIKELTLGDHTEQIMTIMFLDIRDFTTLSEKMTPSENFKFINSFLSVMVPTIREHHGIVDKYIGDAIMAIFPEPADQALKCALLLIKNLKAFNQQREKENQPNIRMGIGINTGKVMVGIVGQANRMSATVISDEVNLAAHVESLTKNYPNTPIILTESTIEVLREPQLFRCSELGQVQINGKEIEIWGLVT